MPAVLSAIAASLSALAAFSALILTLYFHYLDRDAAINDRLLEHPREALFNALKVIDHVYSNEPIGRDGRIPNPHHWDIQLARDADNQMRVYCQFPETLMNFRTALGLYNPTTQKPSGINLEAFESFRKQVARELKLPEPVGFDKNMQWMETLAGATSEKTTQ